MRLTMSFCILLITGVTTAVQGHAATCFEASPAVKQDQLHQAASSEPLGKKQREQLIRFLKKLSQDRDGRSEGFFCKKSKGKVAESRSKVTFRAQELDAGRFDFRVLLQGGQHVSAEERLRYTVSSDKLLLGPNKRGNDIVIKALSDNRLTTYEKYRKRSPAGVSIVRETLRHYQLKGDHLSVKNTYYINGALQSENHWLLD